MLCLIPSLSWIVKVFYLLAGHALADYALQDDRMICYKQPSKSYSQWWWWLTAHSLINGLVVGLLTTPWLGMAETGIHWLTDYAKMTQRLTSNQDQAIHILSKLLWATLA